MAGRGPGGQFVVDPHRVPVRCRLSQFRRQRHRSLAGHRSAGLPNPVPWPRHRWCADSLGGRACCLRPRAYLQLPLNPTGPMPVLRCWIPAGLRSASTPWQQRTGSVGAGDQLSTAPLGGLASVRRTAVIIAPVGPARHRRTVHTRRPATKTTAPETTQGLPITEPRALTTINKGSPQHSSGSKINPRTGSTPRLP